MIARIGPLPFRRLDAPFIMKVNQQRDQNNERKDQDTYQSNDQRVKSLQMRPPI